MSSSILGRRLRKAREVKGLTQLEAGRLLDISNANLSAYELGKREPDYEILLRVAELYGCTTDYLLGRIDDPHGRYIEPFSGGRESAEATKRDLRESNPEQDDLVVIFRGKAAKLSPKDRRTILALLEEDEDSDDAD